MRAVTFPTPSSSNIMQAPKVEGSNETMLPPASTTAEAQSNPSPIPAASISTKAEETPSSQPPSVPSSETPADNSPPADLSKEPLIPSDPEPSKSALLQMQINALTNIQSRISALRSLPAHLLIFHPNTPLISLGGMAGLGIDITGSDAGAGPPGTDALTSLLTSDANAPKAQNMGAQAYVAFRMLNEVKNEMVKNFTQDALKAARDSEARDNSNVELHGRRERKKRRIATADSPAPFPSFQLQVTNVFPSLQQKDVKIAHLEDVPVFIREYNKRRRGPALEDQSSGTKLTIWAQTRPFSGAPRHVSDPLTVRVAIRDVAMVFVKLTHRRSTDGGSDQPAIESIVALGTEGEVFSMLQKSPHSHSDFTVYQKLTQQITRMVEKEPGVSFPQLIDLLASYEKLFTVRCSICERVLSEEGHVPPVVRVWIESSGPGEAEPGKWDARHVTCLHA
ncbi:hypothetical protein DFH11DRAFT_1540268 [Phellopilus nigrolimitatus]|nr:hypothetical protein DFH11DRAFT_1540268 [Phellopilus nigrolimitatus]